MIITRIVLNTALLAAMIGGFVSCSKMDRKPPNVTLIQPSAIYSLAVPGNIPVKFTAMDDRILSQITIELIDEQINNTGVGFTIFPNRNYIEVDTALVVNDILLNSGKYYLRVRAFDGIQTGTAYTEIQLTGVPRMMDEILLFSSGNPALMYQKQSGIWNNTQQFSGALSGAAFHATNQRLCVTTNQPGSMQVWNLNTGALAWSENIADAPPANATGELHYIAQATLFAGIKQSSSIVFAAPEGILKTLNINLSAGHLVKAFHIDSPNVVSLQEDVSGQNISIVTGFSSSGAFRNSLAINEVPVAVQPISVPIFLIVTNSGGEGRIRHYDAVNNTLSVAVITNPILWVRKIGSVFLLGTASHVLRYTTSGNVSTFYPNTALDAVYDEVNDAIYLLKPGELLRLNSSGSILTTENVPADAIRLLCRYNK